MPHVNFFGAHSTLTRAFARDHSRPRFVHHFFPAALGFQQELDDFADGTVAAAAGGGIVRGAFYFGHGVGDGDGEADALHHRNVWEIVADVGDFGVVHAGALHDFFVDR